MEKSRTLNARLLDLRNRFIKTVPDRLGAISETLAQCATHDTTATHRLHHQFHTLAGTAGTYGLLEIAAAASEGEEACADAQSSLDGESFHYLQYLVDQLRRAATGAVEEREFQAA